MRRVALQLIARALGLRSACRPPVEQPANALDPYIATACQFCGAFAAALRSLRRGPFSLQSRYSARRRRALPGATPAAVSQWKQVALDKTSVHEQQRLASSRNTGAALRSHSDVMNLVCFQEPPCGSAPAGQCSRCPGQAAGTMFLLLFLGLIHPSSIREELWGTVQVVCLRPERVWKMASLARTRCPGNRPYAHALSCLSCILFGQAYSWTVTAAEGSENPPTKLQRAGGEPPACTVRSLQCRHPSPRQKMEAACNTRQRRQSRLTKGTPPATPSSLLRSSQGRCAKMIADCLRMAASPMLPATACWGLRALVTTHL